MTCTALRWVVVALGLRGHAAALLGDAGWTHAAHAGRSVVWGSRNVRMAQQLPEDGPAAAWCVGAAELDCAVCLARASWLVGTAR